MLWRLQAGPPIAVEPEGERISQGNLDHDSPTTSVDRGGLKCADGIVIVFEEMPHRNSVEAFTLERLLVEKAAVELDAFERRAAA